MLDIHQLRESELIAKQLSEDSGYAQFLEKKSETFKLSIKPRDPAYLSKDKLTINPNLIEIEYTNKLLIKAIATYAWVKLKRTNKEDFEYPYSQSIFNFRSGLAHGTTFENMNIAITLAMLLPCDMFIEDIELDGGVDLDVLSKRYQVTHDIINSRIINLQELGELI